LTGLAKYAVLVFDATMMDHHSLAFLFLNAQKTWASICRYTPVGIRKTVNTSLGTLSREYSNDTSVIRYTINATVNTQRFQ